MTTATSTTSLRNGAIRAHTLYSANNSGHRPLLFVQGWGGSQAIAHSLAEHLLAQVPSVTYFDFSSLDVSSHDCYEAFVPTPEYIKALGIYDLVKKSTGRFDIIAHSEGAIAAAMAAYLLPEKFNTVLLIGPAGLLVRHTFTSLAWQFLRSSLSEIFSREYPYNARRVFQYFGLVVVYVFTNPIQQFYEALSTFRSQTLEIIKKLPGKGVHVIVAGFESDKLFPGSEFRKVLEGDVGISIVVLPGGHNALYMEPNEFSVAVNTLLHT